MKNKIVLISEYFYPAERNDAILLTKIAERFSINNDLYVICTTQLNSKEELDFIQGKIFRLNSINSSSTNIILKVIRLLLITFKLITKAIFFIDKDDKVFSVTNPVFILPFLILIKKIKKFELTLLVYDIFPDNLVATKFLKKKSFIFKLLQKIYKWSYSNCDNLIVIGRDMELVIKEKTQNKVPIRLLENWCDETKIIPQKKEENTIIKKFNLENKIVFSFVGNFGLVQNIENLLSAASLVENEDFILLLIGSGAETKKIESFIESNTKRNVIYAGRYPNSEENIFLNACDVSIISLHSMMYGLGVPSKSYYNMAAEKPLLYLGHADSEIAKVIRDNDIGWIEESSEAIVLAKRIESICRQKENFLALGKKSRDTLVKNYSEKVILSKYENLFNQR